MNWSVVLNSFVGSILALLIVIAVGIILIVIWDYFDRRKSAKAPDDKLPKQTPSELLERHLEEFVVENFAQLFPSWSIYRNQESSLNGAKPAGVRYRTPAGEIDILCVDDRKNFIVIELKRGKSPDTVVAQIDPYIDWVSQHIAQPGQSVRGIIIAKKHDGRILHSTARKDDVELMTYRLLLSPVAKAPRQSTRVAESASSDADDGQVRIAE